MSQQRAAGHRRPTTDVLVVGAGPAGSVAALVLARAGVRVRMIDRAAFPRDKLCGDTVNPGALAVLDALGVGEAVRAIARPVAGMTVTGPNGARVAADYPAGLTGAALTRRELDRCLVEAAIAAGADFEDRVAVKAPLLVPDGRVTGVTIAGVQRLDARVVIAADGRASRLGAALGLTRFGAQPRRWAFGAYYEGVSGLTSRGEMHIRSGGYIGVAPLPGGIANVCVVSEIASLRAKAGLKARLYEGQEDDVTSGVVAAGLQARPRGDNRDVVDEAIAADAMLRERFVHARRVSEVSVLGPLASEATAAGVPGLLLAGDAAGFVDPMTGDGLRFAIRGGMLAAAAALRELETGVPQHEALARDRRREFAGKWRLNRALRALVASPRGVTIAAAIAVRWAAPVRSLIAIAGDVPLAREALV